MYPIFPKTVQHSWPLVHRSSQNLLSQVDLLGFMGRLQTTLSVLSPPPPSSRKAGQSPVSSGEQGGVEDLGSSGSVAEFLSMGKGRGQSALLAGRRGRKEPRPSDYCRMRPPGGGRGEGGLPRGCRTVLSAMLIPHGGDASSEPCQASLNPSLSCRLISVRAEWEPFVLGIFPCRTTPAQRLPSQSLTFQGLI